MYQVVILCCDLFDFQEKTAGGQAMPITASSNFTGGGGLSQPLGVSTRQQCNSAILIFSWFHSVARTVVLMLLNVSCYQSILFASISALLRLWRLHFFELARRPAINISLVFGSVFRANFNASDNHGFHWYILRTAGAAAAAVRIPLS